MENEKKTQCYSETIEGKKIITKLHLHDFGYYTNKIEKYLEILPPYMLQTMYEMATESRDKLRVAMTELIGLVPYLEMKDEIDRYNIVAEKFKEVSKIIKGA